jgi:uncharacterized membrane protein
MVPFIVLITLFGFFYLLGSVGLPLQLNWLTSLRLALAGMFLLTASAHWGRRRRDLVAMVPPVFPRPDLLVTVTGLFEIAGAVGLMLPQTAPYAALVLCFLLLLFSLQTFMRPDSSLVLPDGESRLCCREPFCSSYSSLLRP